MKTVSKGQLISILRDLNIQPGDGLLVHSALQFLGQPQGGVEMYVDALCTAIDFPQGTIAVPTFNFSFAKGDPYDPDQATAEGMGALSEHIRQLPAARRTRHPMQSLAVIGRHADDLAGRDTPSAFDPGSAFERMLALDFKILLLGADIDAISMIHYSEQRFNVPYRYWKDFTGRVKTPGGWEERTYRMYVRDMALDPKLTLHPVRAYLIEHDQYHSVPLNYGDVSLVQMRHFVPAVDYFLAKNPYSLMLNRPDM